MIKFIKSLFAPAVKIETPVAEYKVEAPVVETAPKAKKPAVKKATTRKPKVE